MAKYLCVLVSGFLERSVEDVLVRHSSQARPTVSRYIERTLRIGNLNTERLCQLLAHFDEAWPNALAAELSNGGKDAIDSVHGLRNQVAHGTDVGLSLATITDYHQRIGRIVDRIDQLAAG